MYKFRKLIANEFVKMFRSKVALVCLIILIAVVVFNILMTSAVEIDGYEDWFKESELESMIEHYQMEMENTQDADEIEAWQFEIAYLTDLLENDVNLGGWRYEQGIYYEIFWTKWYEPENTDKIAQYEAYLAQDGYTKYCLDKLSEKDLSNAWKWKYETCIALSINPDDSDDFRYDLIEETVYDLETLEYEEENGFTDSSQETINRIAVNKYRIENKIATDVESIIQGSDYGMSQATFWGAVFESTSMLVMVGIFCIIIAGRSVASEFSGGTYKLLVLNPVKRWKLLMAKYASVLLYGLMLTGVLFLLTGTLGALRYGDTIKDVLVTAENGVVKTASPLWSLMLQYLLAWVKVLVMATLAFCISSLVRSQAAAVGISIAFYLSSELINVLLAALSVDIGRFTFFANWDLLAIYNGQSQYIGQSLPFAITVLAVYMVVFLLTAWDAFVRREL